MRITKLLEERRKEKRRREMIKTAKNIGITAAASVSVGALGGALGGVLLAPKSGKETRTDIKNKTIETNNKIKSKGNEIKNNINEGIKSNKDNIIDAKSRLKAYLAEKKAVKNIAPASEELEEVAAEEEVLIEAAEA